MRTTQACFLAAALALPAGALAQPLPVDHALPAPAGISRLLLPGEGVGPVPLVILLPDALGDQGRSEAYVEALAARGIATLVVGLDAREGVWGDVLATARAAELARAWAVGQAPTLDAELVGLLGFGIGGRAALAAANGAPVVALDPGCAGLALPEYSPVLVVHGRAASDAATCGAMREPAGTAILGLPGATHAWDLPPALAPGGALMPSPSGEGRQRARPDPAATGVAAEAAASWLHQQLTPPRSAAR
jgi:dienelactone hydrolase